MKKLNLNEKFICRIWEEKSYFACLETVDGKGVDVIDYGTKNTDAGPDYKNAVVKIDGVIYSGSIEIHRSLKDWYLHHHKGDNKYNDLILHVVFYGDDIDKIENPFVKKRRNIPTVILSEFLTDSIHNIWREIISNPEENFRLPCFQNNKIVDQEIKSNWLNNLGFKRLEYKTERIKNRLEEISDSPNKSIYWEQVLFEFICEALGYSKNKEQFLKLSGKIDLAVIKNMKLNNMEIDSLLFGFSGFLFDLRFKDLYINEVKAYWDRLKNILRKEIMDKSEWNFFRLRPSNFPTFRIAYSSGLLFEIINRDFFKTIVKSFEESNDIKKDLEKIFLSVTVSDYWMNHYNFGKESKSTTGIIGIERIGDIIINVLLPALYLYAITFEKNNLKKKVEYYYSNVKQKTSSNEVIRIMEDQFNFTANTLASSQGLIHLHNFYCIQERCSECEIGKLVFKDTKTGEPLKIILY